MPDPSPRRPPSDSHGQCFQGTQACSAARAYVRVCVCAEGAGATSAQCAGASAQGPGVLAGQPPAAGAIWGLAYGEASQALAGTPAGSWAGTRAGSWAAAASRLSRAPWASLPVSGSCVPLPWALLCSTCASWHQRTRRQWSSPSNCKTWAAETWTWRVGAVAQPRGIPCFLAHFSEAGTAGAWRSAPPVSVWRAGSALDAGL